MTIAATFTFSMPLNSLNANSKDRSKSKEIPESIIHEVLYWLYFDCDCEKSGIRYRPGQPLRTKCLHAKDLLALLKVSKQWFPIASRHLWARFANFRNLLMLLSLNNTMPLNRFVNARQVQRWEFYSKFIVNLQLGNRWEFMEDLRTVHELAVLLRGQPLLPRLNTLTVHESWTETTGSHLIIVQLLTAVTPKISISFKAPPDPEFLYIYLTALSNKTDSVHDLAIRFAWPKENERVPVNEHFHPILYRSSHKLFAELASLQRLSLDPSLVTAPLLNIIGDLPRLKHLELGVRKDRGRAILSDSQYFKWVGKFPALLTLQIKTDFLHLPTFLMSCFSGLYDRPLSLAHFTVLTEEIFPRIDAFNFKFLDNLPKNLEGITFDYVSDQARCTEITYFEHLVRFPDLRELHIHHTKYLLINSATLKDLLPSCPRLRTLSLVRHIPTIDTALIESPIPVDFADWQGPGLDLSILGVLAIHAPNLEEINLSVLACKTSPLVSESNTNPGFRRLRILKLSTSLLNFKRRDFQMNQAASFLSVLVKPSTQLIVPPLKLERVERNESLDYQRRYNTFLRLFVDKVWEDVNTRASQTSRVISGVEQINEITNMLSRSSVD